jgi:integrase
MSAPKNWGVLAQQYLRERRRLGFELRHMGQALRSFTRYADRLKPRRPVTLELMADWARHDRGHSTDPRTWARRLKILRPFTRWLQQFEPRTEVPDDTVFGPIGERSAPHIYTEQEIAQLLRAAEQLAPALRGATYATLFGLLVCTGLRVSEAVRLRNADVDLKAGVLTVRRTKFAKSRHVPLHPSALERLRQYRRLRDRWITPTEESAFFVGSRGRLRGQPLSRRSVDRVMQRMRSELHWPNRGAHHAPRVHDLRHSSGPPIIPATDGGGGVFPGGARERGRMDGAIIRGSAVSHWGSFPSFEEMGNDDYSQRCCHGIRSRRVRRATGMSHREIWWVPRRGGLRFPDGKDQDRSGGGSQPLAQTARIAASKT